MLSFHTNLLKKDSFPLNQSSNLHNKKIKDYSYNPNDRIGKGFSSIVYKGTNDVTNEIVAIKAIDMKGVKDAISRQMLQCEIEALRTIKHHNVLKVFDVIKESSHCYIITEFCNEGDLSGLIKKKKRFTEEEMVRYLKDIVSGFIEIGHKGFLHRDLKLANIFISNNTAKIADFGFAKKNKFTSQKEKYNVGSPLYMSPEALKKNIYSLKNDIWSIGVMAYEMLHGETPWQCKTQKELIDKMTRIPVQFRQSLKVSQPTKSFIKKCLQVQQKQRMSLEDLKVWMSGQQFRNPKIESDSHILAPRSQNLPPKLNLYHKPISNVEKLSYQAPIQTTQRHTSRSQRNLNENKQNMGGRSSGLGTIPKSMVERNNGIVVNEINTFRLIYKLMEKMRKSSLNDNNVVSLLGNEVIRRITGLRNCFDGSVNQYGLGMVECYLNQRSNPGIKKYKSVVMQYFKKYTSEIKSENFSSVFSLSSQIRKFLDKRMPAMKDDEDLIIFYWMVEYLSITRETSKQKLDSIIEPKSKISKSDVQQRIREVC